VTRKFITSICLVGDKTTKDAMSAKNRTEEITSRNGVYSRKKKDMRLGKADVFMQDVRERGTL